MCVGERLCTLGGSMLQSFYGAELMFGTCWDVPHVCVGNIEVARMKHGNRFDIGTYVFYGWIEKAYKLCEF